MSEAVTQGVRVTVRASYLAQQSMPASGHFVFAYHVTITNEGRDTVQLKTRHWIITDGNAKIEEVRGEGVVGEKPVLRSGESFEYTSGCVLKTPWGTMHGTYQMQREDGTMFDVEIAPFLLATPAMGSQMASAPN
ncbi:MAG: Co2+/Mg2+ efflux protein ApaG [Deltaproteobacteria bacterium]|nr:Co2+/Mg2+ efflux protein ApaG [Deltaproteobacteria bacterium]